MIYFICGIVVLTVLGVLAGAVRRYTRTSVWGLTVLLTFVTIFVTVLFVGKSNEYYVYIISGVTVGSFILWTILLSILGKALKAAKQARRAYNEMSVRDRLDEIDAGMRDAVERKDKREYRRLKARRNSVSSVSTGAGGVLDVIFGGISGGVNWGVAASVLVLLALTLCDFSFRVFPVPTDNVVAQFFSDVLATDLWTGWGRHWVLDIVLLCILCGTFRIGYRAGISTFLCAIVIIGLIGVAGYSSYLIAVSPSCSGLVNSVSDGMLSALPAQLEAYKHTISVGIITAVVFVLLLIVVIVIGILLPKLVDRLRENAAFNVIDGCVGAVVLFGVVFGLLLVIGAVTYSLLDVAIVDRYFEYSRVADMFYKLNPIGEYVGDFIEKLRTGTLIS